jgi:DnaJ-class molecular chaperone
MDELIDSILGENKGRFERRSCFRCEGTGRLKGIRDKRIRSHDRRRRASCPNCGGYGFIEVCTLLPRKRS